MPQRPDDTPLRIFPGAPAPRESLGERPDDTPLSSTLISKRPDDSPLKLKEGVNKFTFNNSSYSGTDIKVLVHKYKSPSQDLNSDIDRASAVYFQVKDLLIGLVLNIIPAVLTSVTLAKGGNRNDVSFSDNIDLSFQLYRNQINKIFSVENEIKDTGFMQFIGQSLQGRFADLLSNPTGFTQQINQTNLFLDNLLKGWSQQLDAIQKVSGDFITTKVLAELQTLSVSSYREKTPVRACGNTGVKGYTKGPRTVAGTMIFTVFDRNVLFELLDISSFDADDQFTAAIKDQLPPMDITIQFANELGALSRMTIYGLEFVSEGQTMSIEDIILEDVCQWVARDVDPMTPVLNDKGEPFNALLLNFNQAIAQGRGNVTPFNELRASDLRGSEWDLQPGSGENAAFTRFRNRTNPFF